MKRRKLRGGTNRLGETIRSNNCGMMRIIKYNDAMDIEVKFKTGSIVKTQYNNFKIGTVKDPLFPNLCGVGYIGSGKYKPIINNKKTTTEYSTWTHMLNRCYDPYFLNNYPTYQNTAVCKEWLNFQNFAEWFENNYYKLENGKIDIDKDIIKKGNKIYCPKYCSFVPRSINLLLTKNDKSRGKYPVGVYFYKNKYVAQLRVNGKIKYIGRFTTPTEAFNSYKKTKEKQIKNMANEYKDVLDKKVYNTLMKYKVEITD